MISDEFLEEERFPSQFALAFEHYNASVFKIAAHEDGWERPSMATGFLVRKNNRRFIVTSKTVAKFRQIRIVNTKNEEVIPTKIHLCKKGRLNIALIECDWQQVKHASEFLLSTLSPSKQSISILEFGRRSAMSDIKPKYHIGKFDSVSVTKFKKNYVMLSKTSDGAMGAPLVNEFGFVVGMLLGRCYDRITYPIFKFVPSKDIHEFVEEVILLANRNSQ